MFLIFNSCRASIGVQVLKSPENSECEDSNYLLNVEILTHGFCLKMILF